jgi:SAM-dependent methyltransferase
VLNPPSQYRDDVNLRARQRLWQYQIPAFDFQRWVLDLAAPAPGQRVLDLGCGNGSYLRELSRRHIQAAVGCDLSFGMLQAAAPATTVCAGASALPFAPGVFDLILAPHMLYHVENPAAGVREVRRVLAGGGAFVAVTNGAAHIATVRACVEAAVTPSTPGWKMLDAAVRAFSLENGHALLREAFESVECIRPDDPGPIVIRDPGIVADYVASVGDYYQTEVARPWAEVTESVRRQVARIIVRDKAFTTTGDVGAFVCR